MLEVRKITNITKEYPTMYKIVIYKEPHYFIRSDAPKRRKEYVSDDYVPTVSSLKRTKTLVKDYVACNDFEYFCTFTFNPKLVDSFSYSACYSKISVWIHHQRERSRLAGREFKYLVIPEKHKSGRWHFHALISGYTGSLRPSGVYTRAFNPVYNITSFRSGFTTAVRISSKEGVANYVAKYITKDFIKKFNQRRFFASRNLLRPTKTINSKVFSLTLPLSHRLVSENAETFEYIVDKDLNLCNNESTGDVVQCIDNDHYINNYKE